MSKKPVARPYHDVNAPFGVDDKGAFAEYVLQDPEAMPDLALGANVIIRDTRAGQEFWVAGRVVGIRVISPFHPSKENLLYVENDLDDPTIPLNDLYGPHIHQPMVIRVSLDREMELLNEPSRSFVSSPIQRPPSALSRMMFPNIIPNTDSSPSLSEILEVREKGVCLGNIGFGNIPYSHGNEYLTYRWDVDSLDNKHMFIVGESGSGKTVLLKNLALELRKHSSKPRIIMTDVQGDIAQLLLTGVAKMISPTSGWQKRYRESVNINNTSEHNFLEPFQLIIPKSKDYISDDLVALKILAKNRGVTVKDVALRIKDLYSIADVEYLYRVTSEQVALLLQDIEQELVNFDKGTRNKLSLDRFRNSINKLKSKSNGKQVQLASGTSYYESTLDAALRALRSLGEYFDFDQATINNLDNPLDSFLAEGTTIFYLDHLSQNERIMWEMQLVKWLYENKMEIGNSYIFFDEAHQIIPARPSAIGSKEIFERLRVNFERLAREGRKFGVNLILSTQNPKDLHEIVPEQCPNRIVMKINPRNASYALLDPELALIANRFGHGQFWFQSPSNGTPNWVRIHSWAPALPHEPITNFWPKVRESAKNEG